MYFSLLFSIIFFFFFFNDTATTEIYTLSLHDALPISPSNGATIVNAARYLPFVGRLLIGLPFMVSGLSKLAAYGPTIGFIASSRLALPSPLAYAGAVTVEIGCGLLIVAGYQARVVAAVLALFCLTTAAFFHTKFADPNQTFHFIKNLVMAGGLLQVVTYRAGALSIHNRLSKSRAQTGGAAHGG